MDEQISNYGIIEFTADDINNKLSDINAIKARLTDLENASLSTLKFTGYENKEYNGTADIAIKIPAPTADDHIQDLINTATQNFISAPTEASLDEVLAVAGVDEAGNITWKTMAVSTAESTNCIKKDDYATFDDAGVIKVGNGLSMHQEQYLQVDFATSVQVQEKTDTSSALTPALINDIVKAGLTGLTDEEKDAIKDQLDINGTAGETGAVIYTAAQGLKPEQQRQARDNIRAIGYSENGNIELEDNAALIGSDILAHTLTLRNNDNLGANIVPETEVNSEFAQLSFYGSESDEPTRLHNIAPGINDTDAVNFKQMNDTINAKQYEKLIITVGEHEIEYDGSTSVEIDIPIVDINGEVILTDFVKNTDYASTDQGGVIKTNNNYGTAVDGNGCLYFINATADDIANRDEEESGNRVLKARNIDDIVKEGLAYSSYLLDKDEQENAQTFLGIPLNLITYSPNASLNEENAAIARQNIGAIGLNETIHINIHQELSEQQKQIARDNLGVIGLNEKNELQMPEYGSINTTSLNATGTITGSAIKWEVNEENYIVATVYESPRPNEPAGIFFSDPLNAGLVQLRGIASGIYETDAVNVKQLNQAKNPTPNKLIFTGAVSGEFDGSATTTIDIPIVGASGEIIQPSAVLYTNQSLDGDQKVQARENIGALGLDENNNLILPSSLIQGHDICATEIRCYNNNSIGAYITPFGYTDDGYGNLVFCGSESDELVRLSGIAPGSHPNDAVNLSQLRQVIAEKPTYELIGTYTFDPDDPSKVKINRDSEGDTFELQSFIIKAYAAFVNKASNLYMTVNNSPVIGNGKISNLAGSLRSFNIFFNEEPDGTMKAQYSASAMSDSYYNAQMPIDNTYLIPPIGNAGPKLPITYIELSTANGSSTDVPVKAWIEGSTFELWGVRA